MKTTNFSYTSMRSAAATKAKRETTKIGPVVARQVEEIASKVVTKMNPRQQTQSCGTNGICSVFGH